MSKNIDELLNMTDQAKAKISEFYEEIGDAGDVRFFSVGKGCSGMDFGFTIDDNQSKDDLVFLIGDIRLLVDCFSYPYVIGAEVDYISDLQGAGFRIVGNQSKTSCGCGSSQSG